MHNLIFGLRSILSSKKPNTKINVKNKKLKTISVLVSIEISLETSKYLTPKYPNNNDKFMKKYNPPNNGVSSL